MKRKIRIAFIATAAIVVLWIPELLIQVLIRPIKRDEVPLWFSIQFYTIITGWVIFGIYYLIKHFPEVKKEVSNFINE